MPWYAPGGSAAAPAWRLDRRGWRQPIATFAKDVAPILQAKCEECHRKGTAAPMSLVTYQETRPWAKSIRERVITRNMPPWHIDKTVGIQTLPERPVPHRRADRDHRPLGGFRRAARRSQGLPPPETMAAPKRAGSWRNSSASPIWSSNPSPTPCRPKARTCGGRPLTAIPLTEPRWVRAVEIRPATAAGRTITHHALAQLQQDEPGARRN